MAGTSVRGNQAFSTTWNIYTAVSRADTSRAAKPTSGSQPPISTAARAMYHLLTKPLKRGMPVRAQAAAVKQAKVTGIYRARPSSWGTYSRWA